MNEGTPITGWSALAEPPPADERFWADVRRGLEAVEFDPAGLDHDMEVEPIPLRDGERRRGRRRLLVAAVAAFLVALAVVTIGLLTGRTPDSIGPIPADESPDPSGPTPTPTSPSTLVDEPVEEMLGLDGLADVIPASTTWLSFVDVGAMRAFYGVDAADLAERIDDAAPIPMDEVSKVEGAIRVAIPPFAQPFDNTHADAIDLRSIDFIVTVQTPASMTVIATNQDSDQLAAVYESGGFEPIGDERLLHPVGPATGGSSGGSPAVELAPGRIVLAPSAENLDAFARDEVGDTALRTLLEAAAGARAGSVLVPGTTADESASCNHPFALVVSDAGYELLLLDGGTDSLDPDRLRGLFEAFPAGLDQIGPGRVDSEMTRYRYVPDESGDMQVLGSADVLWTSIQPDAPPLSPCPS